MRSVLRFIVLGCCVAAALARLAPPSAAALARGGEVRLPDGGASAALRRLREAAKADSAGATWTAAIATDTPTLSLPVEGSGLPQAKLRFAVAFTLSGGAGGSFVAAPGAGGGGDLAFQSLMGGMGAATEQLAGAAVGDGSGAAGCAATVTNFFENADAAFVLPAGVVGTQPAANTLLHASASFTYTAVFQPAPAALCSGGPFSVVTTASVVAAEGPGCAPGQQLPQTVRSSVPVELVGCGSGAAAQLPAQPAQLAEPPAQGGGPRRGRSSIPMPTGLQYAEAGSQICGQSGAPCNPEEVCVDGTVCCPAAGGFVNCGGSCCGAPRVCILGTKCMAEGSHACGDEGCTAQQQCMASAGGGVACCTQAEVCGSVCCPITTGNLCLLGQCLPAGSTQCGPRICSPQEHCLDQGAGTCCPNGQILIRGRCYAPDAQECGSNVCQQGQVCKGGNTCCEASQRAINGGCYSQDIQECGGQPCPPGQVCKGGNTCCAPDDIFIDGSCYPRDTQICYGQPCPPGQVCKTTRCCPPDQDEISGSCQPKGTFQCGNGICQQGQKCCTPHEQIPGGVCTAVVLGPPSCCPPVMCSMKCMSCSP